MNANNNEHHSAKIANKDLTPQERKAKRELKRRLKVQQKRARLETRLRHAMSRNDSRTEAETRQALQAFNEKERTETTLEEAIKPHEETPERLFVQQIFSELQRQQQIETCRETKQAQTEQAVALLRNMTKGTQQKHMFKDAITLWGYTRQKFFERAMLVCESFLKLRPTNDETPEEADELRRLAWDRLSSIRRICSIGCGPGNDAVGVSAFLKAIGKTCPQLDRALLLDWAMEDWKLVVDPLCHVIVPKYVQTVETSACDISKSLLDSDDNRLAQELILDDDSLADVDLFLVSYLLTEVRGQWYTFMKELIQISKRNTLYYFADPTPWQLRVLVEQFGDQLDFIWLDSSMDQPELQPLEKRLGPAVLLGYKRDNSASS